jgi:hypothetical protein
MANDDQPQDVLPMTSEERSRRYERMRRRSQESAIFARPRDPNVYVRWVRDDKHDVSRHRHMGFRIVKENPKLAEDKRRIDTVVELGEDGTYRTGDVVLMEIAKDDYDYLLQEAVQRSRDQVDVGKETFRSEAEKLEVPTFERERGSVGPRR